jgi:DNA-binding NtrC family response regulator
VAAPPDEAPRLTVPLGTSMAEAERRLILATFDHFGRHKEQTAAALGLSMKTLYNRLRDYTQGSAAETTAAPPAGA